LKFYKLYLNPRFIDVFTTEQTFSLEVSASSQSA